MTKKIDLSLYLILDYDYLRLTKRSILSVLLPALKAGVTAVQLRCKNLDTAQFLKLAGKTLKFTRRAGVPLIINDRPDIAAKCRADGAHVGLDDTPVHEARKIIGKNRLLGVSASTYAEAMSADSLKADYIGLGPVFKTENKDKKPLSLAALRRLLKKLKTPVVAIGGIKEYNILKLKKCGVKNFCFISEICGSRDVFTKVKKLKELINDPA
ncbi:MAG TPA: thiamine phosphate synthase [Candidatus Goldiibacteriota bacterium]|nr:thiamine phosphate synthase [Candidatus Goldiibacteriota bacterium]